MFARKAIQTVLREILVVAPPLPLRPIRPLRERGRKLRQTIQIAFGASGCLDLVDGGRYSPLVTAKSIDLRHDNRRDPLGLTANKLLLAILEAKVERQLARVGSADDRFAKMTTTHVHQAPFVAPKLGDDFFAAAIDDRTAGIGEHPTKATNADARGQTTDDHRAQRRDSSARDEHLRSEERRV